MLYVCLWDVWIYLPDLVVMIDQLAFYICLHKPPGRVAVVVVVHACTNEFLCVRVSAV